MNCKNCDNTLRSDFSFCPDCGAKVIRNRITVKNLWFDITERYFNLDTSFLRTLKDMVFRPERVCQSYIDGVRKKYLNPISLLAISLTLSGAIIFIMKNVSWENMDFSDIMFSNGAGSKKIMSITMEYSSILFLFYIPLLAICGYSLFNSKNYNLPEHIIIAVYALASFSIITFPYAVVMLLIFPHLYIATSLYYSAIMIIYCLYVSYRNAEESLVQLLWRVPLYMTLFIVGFMGVSIFFNVVLLLTGTLSLEDIMPKK